MQFDPDISEWTNEQLEEARLDVISNIKGFIEIFGDENDMFLSTLHGMLNTFETEITERGLHLLDKS